MFTFRKIIVNEQISNPPGVFPNAPQTDSREIIVLDSTNQATRQMLAVLVADEQPTMTDEGVITVICELCLIVKRIWAIHVANATLGKLKKSFY